MKEKLTKNSGLKLLSLFCAFFVWMAVVNIANPVKVDTIEVPVTIVNPEVLEKSNLTYEIVGKKTAVVTYRIKTKDAYKISASNFNAYADLSEMYDVTGAIPIKVEVLKNNELFQTAPTVKSPEVIKVRTEELQTKPFQVQVNTSGTPLEGYVPGPVNLIPDTVYVKGPVSQVGGISSVGIEINIEGASADVSDIKPIQFYDANGNILTSLGDSVKALNGEIAYSMQILKVKNLPIDFVVTGEVKEGYKYTGVECSVTSVPVAGLKSALAAISSIAVQSPELNIEGATGDKSLKIDLASYIDPNITIAGMEDTVVTVTLKVEPLQEKTFSVGPKDVVLTGKSGDYAYEMSEEPVTIKIRGLKDDLDSLSVGKMNISADVTGMTTGVHEARLKLVLDDAYEIITLPACQIEVTEKSTGADDKKPAETEPQDETDETAE